MRRAGLGIAMLRDFLVGWGMLGAFLALWSRLNVAPHMVMPRRGGDRHGPKRRWPGWRSDYQGNHIDSVTILSPLKSLFSDSNQYDSWI